MAQSTVEYQKSSSSERVKTEPMQVLHVDDDIEFLKTAKPILELQGAFEVDTVQSAEKAMEKMKQKAYDCIISDYVMPGKDGLQFLRELRGKRNNTPFIVFTGKGREEVAIKALNLGADRYVSKIGDPATVYGELAYSVSQAVERKRADMEVWRREERLSALFASSPDAITVVDLNGNISECNHATLDMLGYSSKSELIGKNGLVMVAKKDRERFRESLRKLFEQGSTRNNEYAALTKDGREFQAELSSVVTKDFSGHPTGFVGFTRDISERKKIEETLRESKEQISGFLDSATDGFMLFDSQLNLVEINKSALKILGLSRDDVIRKNVLDISPDTEEKGRCDKYREVIITGEPFIVEELVLHPKFGEKHIALKAFKVGDGLGIIGTDITERKKAEAEVESARKKLESIIDSMADPVCITTLEDKITMVNNAMVDLFQVSREKLLTMRGIDLATEEDMPKVFKAVQDLLTTGLPQNVEVTGRLYGAKDRPFWMKLALLNDEKGEPAGIVTVARDITESKKAEETLRSNESKYRTLLENLPQKVFFKDENSVYISCNENYARDLKINSCEITNKTDFDFYPKELAEKYRADDKRIMESGKTEDIEEEYVQDGRKVFVHTVKTPVKDGNGNVVGILGIFWDITESKKTEATLLESEKKFKLIFEGATDGILAADPKTKRLVFANPRVCEITGYSLKELLKLSVDDIHPKRELPYVIAQFTKQVTGEQTLAKDIPILRKDKQIAYCDVNSRLLEIGGQQCLVGFFRDITERKKSEDERHKLVYDLNKRINELNCLHSLSKLVDKSDSLDDILHGMACLLPSAWQYPDIACARIVIDDREFATKNFKESRWKQQADIMVHGRKAGFVEVRYLEERPRIDEGPFLKEERSLINTLAERLGKIAERKKAEIEARTAQKMYKSVCQNIPGMVYRARPDWSTEYISESKAICGYAIEELNPGKINWLNIIHPNDKERVMAEGAPIRSRSESITQEYRIIDREGNVRWVEDHKTSSFSDDGAFNSVDGVVFDVTERKNAEEKLRVLNEKLGVVGGLTRHDVRNKLSAFTNNLYLAKHTLPSDSKALTYMEDMESVLQQTTRILDFAATYEKLGAEELVSTDVGKSFDEAVSLLSGLQSVKAVNECRGLTVVADSLLRQLFYNLVDNSLEHGKRVSQIKVYHKDEGDKLQLVYEDDGVGIPKAEKSKIFDKGYESTGYGLFMIKKICEVYGWNIKETGPQGKGAQFTITIAKTNAPPAPPP